MAERAGALLYQMWMCAQVREYALRLILLDLGVNLSLMIEVVRQRAMHCSRGQLRVRFDKTGYRFS